MKKVINVLQFVRGCEPRDPKIDLYEPMRGHIALLRKYGFCGTFLLQYDALIDPRFVALAREAQPIAEIGLWLEVVQPLAERADVAWKGRFPWDWESNRGTLIAYTPSERRKMLDVAVHTFQETFGYTPKSVGAWVLDAVSLQYLQETYGISAACNCVNQYGTDGYTLWGGNTVAYYPSRKNILSPAQTAENQIGVPVFRMLGADPIYQYDWYLRDGMGIVTLEPSLSLWKKPGGGYDKDWIEWFFCETYNDKTGTPFVYAQAGQENSFGWDSMKDGLRLQCEKIAKMRDRGQIETLTLSQTGEWFRGQYSLTPALSQTAMTDWHSKKQKSVWYNSRYYRVNLFLKDTAFGIRDCYLFDENYPERYLSEKCETPACTFDTLPLWDGMRQSMGKESALLRLCDEYGEPLIVKEFTYSQEGDVGICTVKAGNGEFKIKCHSRRLSFYSECKTEFMLIGDTGKKVPDFAVTVKSDRVECVYRGYSYRVFVQKGTLCGNRAISKKGVLEIAFTRREE